MPEAQQDPRREVRLPVRLGGDDLVHEREQVQRLAGHLHVDVERDVPVFWLIGVEYMGLVTCV